MAIVRWDPFDSLFSPADMNRALGGWLRSSDEEKPLRGGAWAPAVDVYEADGAVVVEVELPGVDPGDIDVSIDEGVLTIRGERKLAREVREENYFCVERASGIFQRSMRLAPDVEADKISASCENGVLKVTVPKGEPKKPKSIAVQVETKTNTKKEMK